MNLIKAYLAAFRKSYTYALGRNPYLWFGFAWGLPVPVVSIAFDLVLGPSGRSLPDAFIDHPIQFFLLAHPVLFALVFGALGTLRDELEQENARLVEQLRTEATTDPLTGIANRRHVLEALDSALAQASRSKQPFAVALFDLDEFKRINDERGHLFGDATLEKTAAALQEVVRAGDTLGRYGGDEFLVVTHGEYLPGNPLIERAASAVGRATGLRLSAGVARYPEDGMSKAALIATADARLYETKRQRRSSTPGS